MNKFNFITSPYLQIHSCRNSTHNPVGPIQIPPKLEETKRHGHKWLLLSLEATLQIPKSRCCWLYHRYILHALLYIFIYNVNCVLNLCKWHHI